VWESQYFYGSEANNQKQRIEERETAKRRGRDENNERTRVRDAAVAYPNPLTLHNQRPSDLQTSTSTTTTNERTTILEYKRRTKERRNDGTAAELQYNNELTTGRRDDCTTERLNDRTTEQRKRNEGTNKPNTCQRRHVRRATCVLCAVCLRERVD